MAPAPRDGPPAASPHGYVRQTISQLWDSLPLMLLASLLFSLLCLPAALLVFFGWLIPAVALGALTVAPAWAGLLALEAGIARDGKAHIGAMLKGVPHYRGRSARLALLPALPLVAATLTWSRAALPQAPTIVWVGLAADGLGLAVAAALSLYAFPLMVLFDADLVTALRNALILASRHIVNTFGLVSMAVLFAFAVGYVSSGLLFFLPAVWGLFIINNCRMVVGQELGEG